jgi:hypothetical protein
MDALRSVWTEAGLVDVATRRIDVQRSFVDFDDFWATAKLGPSVAPLFASMAAEDTARIKTRLRAHAKEDDAGRISYGSFANAITGRVPG